MRYSPRFQRLLLSFAVATCAVSAAETKPAAIIAPPVKNPFDIVYPIPPQDQGLPYTTSGTARALAAIRPFIAVFANADYGSRYAYAQGYKLRLDDAQLLGDRGEAVIRGDVLYVPSAFAGVLGLDEIKPAPAPDDLKSKWIYALDRPRVNLPPSVRTLDVGGSPYVALADVAAPLGLKTYHHARGLFLFARAPISFPADDTKLLDCVITLFDTPSKLADPDIATRFIPTLKAQGRWTDHVHTTPAERALLNGPETVFPGVPASAYDYAGFNAALLGSPPPAPGVYPRLLFSPGDIPALAVRMRSQKLGQKTLIEWKILFEKTWWDPVTSDGQIFQKLSSESGYKTLAWPARDISPGAGVIRSLFAGQKPGIHNSHVNYNTNCLTSMALCCLLTDDDVHGRLAATAIANYFRLLEPSLDAHIATTDSQWGVSADAAGNATTAWRGLHAAVAHMDLALALDFGGRWMTAEQKDFMRRFIAKATYGRLDNMQAAPARQRDINHMTWHLTDFLAASAIEGLEGYDPEVIATGLESVRAFLDWGIDEYGYIFESNGKSGGGLQFQILAMIVAERRGVKLWGHPHWRKLLAAQVAATAPNGRDTISSGTWGGSPLSGTAVGMLKAFYPGDLAADYLLRQQYPDLDAASLDLDAYRRKLEKSIAGVRLPGPSYPAFVFTGLYDTDWSFVARAALKLPLTFADPVYGFLSVASDASPEAAWIALHVRANQYIGSGHHHADVGMFYFSSHGVNWITESPFAKSYDGKYHNEVLIDGLAQPDGLPARGSYLGDTVAADAAFATADQTQSYTYRWTNQVLLWDRIPESDVWGRVAREKNWSLSTDPLALAVYKGTQHRKSRPWWPTYNYSNWIPVVQAPFNPVRHAYRTAGLVRGAHSYGLVVDDVKKDDASRLYQWTAMPGRGITSLALPRLAAGDVVLVRSADLAGGQAKPGAPLLLIRALVAPGAITGVLETATDGEVDPKQGPQPYPRISLAQRATQANLRVLLLPLRAGEAPPSITSDPRSDTTTITWPGQTDMLRFSLAADGRTHFTINREGRPVAESP